MSSMSRRSGADVAELLAAIPGVVRVQPLGGDRYRVDCQRDLRAEIARHLAPARSSCSASHFAAPSLNEVYNRYFEEARACSRLVAAAPRLAVDRARHRRRQGTADHLSSARMRILEALVFLTAIAAAYPRSARSATTIGESPFLFLRLLTLTQDPLPSFIALLGFPDPAGGDRARASIRSTASSTAAR